MADCLVMTTARLGLPLDATLPAWEDEAPAADVTSLLPSRAALLDRLTERMPSVDEHPATLLVIGLLGRDTGWPTAASTLAEVTTVLARSVRGDDCLARAGATEFAVLVGGTAAAAQVAADRLTAVLTAAGIGDSPASAGIAELGTGLTASEVLRRASLCLATARTMGAGQVIIYRGTR